MQMAFKYCIFVFIACPFLINGKVNLTPELQKWVEKLHTECAQEGKLTEDEIKSFDITKKDPAMMCFMKCLFTRAQWMDENETLKYDFIKKNVQSPLKEIVVPDLDTCGKKAVGGGNCEKSYNFFICMHQAHPEDWVL